MRYSRFAKHLNLKGCQSKIWIIVLRKKLLISKNVFKAIYRKIQTMVLGQQKIQKSENGVN